MPKVHEAEIAEWPIDQLEPYDTARDLIPDLDEQAFEELKNDIDRNGLKTFPHVMGSSGKILDGIHRVEACRQLGYDAIDCQVFHMQDVDQAIKQDWIELHILRQNAHRRHLEPNELNVLGNEIKKRFERVKEHQRQINLKQRQQSQRADELLREIQGEDESLSPETPNGSDASDDAHGRHRESPQEEGESEDKDDNESDEAPIPAGRSDKIAADMVGGSERGVSRASRIEEEAPDLYRQVQNNEISLSHAEREVRRRKAEEELEEAEEDEEEIPDYNRFLSAGFAPDPYNHWEYPSEQPSGFKTYSREKPAGFYYELLYHFTEPEDDIYDCRQPVEAAGFQPSDEMLAKVADSVERHVVAGGGCDLLISTSSDSDELNSEAAGVNDGGRLALLLIRRNEEQSEGEWVDPLPKILAERSIHAVQRVLPEFEMEHLITVGVPKEAYKRYQKQRGFEEGYLLSIADALLVFRKEGGGSS